MTASKTSGTPPFDDTLEDERSQSKEKEEDPHGRDAAGSASVRLFPRRKAGEIQSKGFRGRAPAVITLQVLEKYFGRPQMKACQELEVSLATMKRLCRKFGIKRWPGPAAPFQHHGAGNRAASSSPNSESAALKAVHSAGEDSHSTRNANVEAAEQLRQLVSIATSQNTQNQLDLSAASSQLSNLSTGLLPGAADSTSAAVNAELNKQLAANPLLASQLQATRVNPGLSSLSAVQQLQTKLLLEQQAAAQTAVYAQYLQTLQALAGAKGPQAGVNPGFPLDPVNPLSGLNSSRCSSMSSLESNSRTASLIDASCRTPSFQSVPSSTGSGLDLLSLMGVQGLNALGGNAPPRNGSL